MSWNKQEVVVEKTRKSFKLSLALSRITIILGLILAFGNNSEFGALLLILGIIASIATKIMIWWNHG